MPKRKKELNPPHRIDVSSTRRAGSSPVSRNTFQSSLAGLSPPLPARTADHSGPLSSALAAFVDDSPKPAPPVPAATTKAKSDSRWWKGVPPVPRDDARAAASVPMAFTGPNITGLMLLAAVILGPAQPHKTDKAIPAATHAPQVRRRIIVLLRAVASFPRRPFRRKS